MPFTLTHAAAAIPLRRGRIVTSALVVGTFAPDFEYFLRLSANQRYGHAILWSLVFTLPVALGVFWMFERIVKIPASMLLPETLRKRLKFGCDQNFMWIVVSIALGIATHLAWDSFTHPVGWVYDHYSVLHEMIGPVPVYKIAQHGSTIVGIGALSVWFAFWYRRHHEVDERPAWFSGPEKVAIVGGMAVVALGVGLARGFIGRGTLAVFVGTVVITSVAVFWWELVVYGLACRVRLRN